MARNWFSAITLAALPLCLWSSLGACDEVKSTGLFGTPPKPAAQVGRRFVAPPVPDGQADEMEVREEVANTVTALLKARDYVGLDRLAQQYREGRERTPSGVFKSFYYYLAISDHIRFDFGETCGGGAQAMLDDWIKAAPRSPPAILAYAEGYERSAFCARGAGWAQEVRPEAWPIYNANLTKAVESLQKNKSAASVDPQWYVEMQELATYLSWDERDFRALHKEATAHFPWSYDIYFSAAMHYLPKWHGSLEEFDDFARQSAQRSEETDGAGLYARLYWLELCCEFHENLRDESNADMALLRESMRDIAIRYPSLWNYNNFAYILCRNDTTLEAKAYLDRISGPPMAPPWPDPRVFEMCKTVLTNTAKYNDMAAGKTAPP